MNVVMNWIPGMNLEMVEKMAIQQALVYFKNNKTAAANALGVAVRTLDNKLEAYAMDAVKMKAVEDERERQRREFAERARGIVPSILDGAKRPIIERNASGETREKPVENKAALRPTIEREVEYESRSRQTIEAPIASATAGVRVESAPLPTGEPSMPVSERQEVQKVPQGVSSSGGKRERRPNVSGANEKT